MNSLESARPIEGGNDRPLPEGRLEKLHIGGEGGVGYSATGPDGYPSDVSDKEWSFCVPYLTLMKEESPQREHPLRELFNGLRWLARMGRIRFCINLAVTTAGGASVRQ